MSRKNLIIGGFLGITLIVSVFFLLKPRQQISAEARTHFDKIYSLSGKLTPEQKETYFQSASTLEKISVEEGRFPQEEMDLLTKHLRQLVAHNPDLILSAQEYDRRGGHLHGHTHGTLDADADSEKQEELDSIQQAMEELEASDLPEGTKEGLRAILSLRKRSLLRTEEETAELNNVFAEYLKTDPEIVGVEKNLKTGEYIKLYPNMLTVEGRRIHHADGTIERFVTGLSAMSNSPANEQALEAYSKAVENTPPWEPLPQTPDIEGLRISFDFEEVYPTTEGGITTSETQQETATAPSAADPDTAANSPTDPTELQHTIDKAFALQDTLENTDTREMPTEELSKFLETAIGIPIDRFLEMSDAEIEEALGKLFTSSPSEIRSSRLPQQGQIPNTSEGSFVEDLRTRFSPVRVNRAVAIINQYGPEEGLRRVKEVDPDIAKQLEPHLPQEKANER